MHTFTHFSCGRPCLNRDVVHRRKIGPPGVDADPQLLRLHAVHLVGLHLQVAIGALRNVHTKHRLPIADGPVAAIDLQVADVVRGRLDAADRDLGAELDDELLRVPEEREKSER